MKVLALPYAGQFCFHSLKSTGKFNFFALLYPSNNRVSAEQNIHMAMLRDTSLRVVP